LFRAHTDSSWWDLVAEWKPPQRWRVGVYRCGPSGKAVEMTCVIPDGIDAKELEGWRLVASVDALEGQFAEE